MLELYLKKGSLKDVFEKSVGLPPPISYLLLPLALSSGFIWGLAAMVLGWTFLGFLASLVNFFVPMTSIIRFIKGMTFIKKVALDSELVAGAIVKDW